MSNNTSSHYVRETMLPEQAAPANTSGLVAWIRANLFNSPLIHDFNTAFALCDLYIIVPPLLNSHLLMASGRVKTVRFAQTAAQGGIQPDGWFGGCWAYVGAYFNQFIYGRYPVEEQWRVNITAVLFFAIGLIPLLMPIGTIKERKHFLFGLVCSRRCAHFTFWRSF